MFRRAVLGRDGWRCKECHRAGRLEVHHLIPVHRAPERELDPSNVVVLCRTCHLGHTRKERQQVSSQRQAWRELVEALLP